MLLAQAVLRSKKIRILKLLFKKYGAIDIEERSRVLILLVILARRASRSLLLQFRGFSRRMAFARPNQLGSLD
jgi:hypothetical protein